ncbi:MAG TPA: hypothetical protein VK772_07770 [Puia sp.]|jgi:hypothetical protein|nr:hypothetical protein [Puia sp.]
MNQKYLHKKLLLIISTFLLISWSRIIHQTSTKTVIVNLAKTDTSVCDKMYDGKFIENSQITLLNLGGAYPNQKITVVIKGADRNKFKTPPETLYAGKTICVKGPVQIYKGRPEIIVTDPQQIVIQ